MPDFSHGRLTKVMLNGVDLSRILNSMDVTGGYDSAETTTFGQGFQSFMTGLRRGGEVKLEGRSEAPGSTILRRAIRDAEGLDTSVMNISLGNDVTGSEGVGLRGLVSDKQFSAAADGVVQFTLGFAGNRGVDDTVQLLSGGTILTVTGTSTSVDDDAASAANTQAIGYLHVVEMTGGTSPSITMKIQDSPDNSVWTDLVVFSAATAARAAQRVVVNDPPARWLRASYTITGTPTSIRCSVSVARGRVGEDVS